MGNTIGQANAVSDKLLDLRGCKFDGKSLAGKTLSGALMVDASFKGADLTEAVMSKAYAGARPTAAARARQRGCALPGGHAHAAQQPVPDSPALSAACARQ